MIFVWVKSQCTFNFATEHYQGILCQVSDSCKLPEVSFKRGMLKTVCIKCILDFLLIFFPVRQSHLLFIWEI